MLNCEIKFFYKNLYPFLNPFSDSYTSNFRILFYICIKVLFCQRFGVKSDKIFDLKNAKKRMHEWHHCTNEYITAKTLGPSKA